MTTRRRLLGGLSAATVGALAGCTGGGSSELPSGYDGRTVETLSAAGSPGDVVPVTPDRVTLLDFFATWCPPCKPQMAELRAVDRRFPGVHLLSVSNQDDADAVGSFWREYEGTWSVALDPELEVFSAYQVGSIPTMVLLDPDGEQRWRHSGLAAADTIGAELTAAGATRDAG